MYYLIILNTLISPLLIYKNIIIYSSLSTLILIYKKDNYHFNSFITGLLFDIITSTYILNALIYLLMSYIINYYFKSRKYNLKNSIIIYIFIILIYNALYFIFNNTFIIHFMTNIIYIYLFNIIYLSIIFLLINNKKYS